MIIENHDSQNLEPRRGDINYVLMLCHPYGVLFTLPLEFYNHYTPSGLGDNAKRLFPGEIQMMR